MSDSGGLPVRLSITLPSFSSDGWSSQPGFYAAGTKYVSMPCTSIDACKTLVATQKEHADTKAMFCRTQYHKTDPNTCFKFTEPPTSRMLQIHFNGGANGTNNRREHETAIIESKGNCMVDGKTKEFRCNGDEKSEKMIFEAAGCAGQDRDDFYHLKTVNNAYCRLKGYNNTLVCDQIDKRNALDIELIEEAGGRVSFHDVTRQRYCSMEPSTKAIQCSEFTKWNSPALKMDLTGA